MHVGLTRATPLVLFLKELPTGNLPAHRTCDVWFGVQPYGPWLARRLGELAQAQR